VRVKEGLLYLKHNYANNDHKGRKGQAEANSRKVPSTTYANAKR
jgi:hypothetical protein